MVPLMMCIDPLLCPYLFLFIGLINAGPEFHAEFVGFSASPIGYIVTTIVAVSRHWSILLYRYALLLLCYDNVDVALQKCLSQESYEM